MVLCTDVKSGNDILDLPLLPLQNRDVKTFGQHTAYYLLDPQQRQKAFQLLERTHASLLADAAILLLQDLDLSGMKIELLSSTSFHSLLLSCYPHLLKEEPTLTQPKHELILSLWSYIFAYCHQHISLFENLYIVPCADKGKQERALPLSTSGDSMCFLSPPSITETASQVVTLLHKCGYHRIEPKCSEILARFIFLPKQYWYNPSAEGVLAAVVALYNHNRYTCNLLHPQINC